MPAFGLDDDVVAAPAFGADDEVVSPAAVHGPAVDETVFPPTQPQSLLKTLQFRTLKGFEQGLGSAARGAERLLDPGALPNSYRVHAAQLARAAPTAQRADEVEIPELQPSRLEQIRRDPAFQSGAAQQAAAERIRSELMRPASSLREAAQEIAGQAGTVAENIPGNKVAGKAAEMAGGMLPLLGAAMVPGVGAPLSAGLAGLQTGGDTYERALDAYKASGLDDATAQRLADQAAGKAGLTSAATFGLLPGPLKASGAAIMSVLKVQSPVVKAALSLAGAATEGGTLMAADHLARSAQEMQSFNPALTWDEALKGAGEQFLVGGVVSGALHVPGAFGVARGTAEGRPAGQQASRPAPPEDYGPPGAASPKLFTEPPAVVNPEAMRELEAVLRGNQLRPAPAAEPVPEVAKVEPAVAKAGFKGSKEDPVVANVAAAPAEPLPETGTPESLARIYRAGDESEHGVKAWSSWSENRDQAEAYLDNPGFGGKTLREETYPLGNVLDVDTTNRRGMSDLAEQLGFAREKGEEWFDNGWRYPWEESGQVKRAVGRSGFDALRYKDDFPEGAETILPLRTRKPDQAVIDVPPEQSASKLPVGPAEPTVPAADNSGKARRLQILKESEGNIYPFLDKGEFAQAYMGETLGLPEGWTMRDAQPSKYGSFYWMVEDPSGERWKLSVRDHDVSEPRAAEFGRPDISVFVEDVNDPKQFASGMDRLEQKLAENANRPDVHSSGPGDLRQPSQQLKPQTRAAIGESQELPGSREAANVVPQSTPAVKPDLFTAAGTGGQARTYDVRPLDRPVKLLDVSTAEGPAQGDQLSPGRSNEAKPYPQHEAYWRENWQDAPGPYTVWAFAEPGEAPGNGSWLNFKDKSDYLRWVEDGGWAVLTSGRAVPDSQIRTYYRVGRLPEDWNSRNSREQRGEGGVSVYPSPEVTSFAGLADRPWYYGKGRQVGTGGDGEPVIIPAGQWKPYRPRKKKGPSSSESGALVEPEMVPTTGKSMFQSAPGKPGEGATEPGPAAPVKPDLFTAADAALKKLAEDIIDPKNVGASFFAGLDRYAAYGAVQAARGALKAGKAIAEAVQTAVEWLRKNHGETGWEEGQFRHELEQYLALPIRKGQHETLKDPIIKKEIERLERELAAEEKHAAATGDYDPVKAKFDEINALISSRTTPVELQSARFANAEGHANELEALRAKAKEFTDRGEPVPREIVREMQAVRENLLAASEEFARGEAEPPKGRIPRAVDAGLQRREPAAGGSGRYLPEFKGRERLPSGGLRDILDGLSAWRRRVGDWWTRRGTRELVTYQKDAADNRAGRAANEAANHVRLTLNRAFGEAGAKARTTRGGLREHALLFVVEADGDRAALAGFHDLIKGSERADSTSGRQALAAINFAETNWEKFAGAADEYKRLTEIQREEELNDGFNSNEWEGGYVYHRWKKSPEALSANPSQASAAPTPFRKPRTVENYAQGIAGGGVPHTLNALDLLSARVADGQRALNEVNWLHGLKSITDPASDEPLAVGVLHKPRRPQGVPRPEEQARGPAVQQSSNAEFEAGHEPDWITVPEVPGYVVQKIGPVEFAIKPEFAGLLTDLTAKSWFEGGGLRRGAKQAFGASKSVMLLFDTFHLGRLALWRAAVSGSPSYRKGATLLDYTRADLEEMGRRGEIPQNWVQDLVENRRRLDLALNTGFNVGQILDNAASDWIHNLPIAGPFNHWLFGQYQRGAMTEAWLIEFERTRNMFPNRPELDVARQVSRDLNSRFGNLGRQGLTRSKTGQDLARLLFLAPQWNESLIRSELGAVGQLLRAPIDSLQHRRLVAGTLLRTTGTLVLGTFLANQILSYAFRGHPTWENPEEGADKKISAWIPDAVGNSPGMFLNPLALPAEYTHLISGQLARSQDTAAAAWRIVNGRLSSPSRALLMLATRKDALGRSLKPGEVLPAMGKALIPAPLGGSAIAAGAKQVVTGEPSEKFPGQFQKQILSSVGVKTDQAPNPEQRMRGLAREFNHAKGIVPSAEFYAGDYAELTEALRRGNQSDAQSALTDLLQKKTPAEIAKHFERWMVAPYTGQRAREAEFMRSLTAEQRAKYEESRVQRRDLARQARAMLRK